MSNNNTKLNDLNLDLLEVQACNDIVNNNEFNKFLCDYLGLDSKSIIKDVSEYKETELELKKKIEKINNNLVNSNNTKLYRNRYFRKKITKEKLKKLNKNCSYYVIQEKERDNFEDNKGEFFLKRRYINNNKTKFHKRLSNKKVRNEFNINTKGSNFKKVYDYKWEID